MTDRPGVVSFSHHFVRANFVFRISGRQPDPSIRASRSSAADGVNGEGDDGGGRRRLVERCRSKSDIQPGAAESFRFVAVLWPRGGGSGGGVSRARSADVVALHPPGGGGSSGGGGAYPDFDHLLPTSSSSSASTSIAQSGLSTPASQFGSCRVHSFVSALFLLRIAHSS